MCEFQNKVSLNFQKGNGITIRLIIELSNSEIDYNFFVVLSKEETQRLKDIIDKIGNSNNDNYIGRNKGLPHHIRIEIHSYSDETYYFILVKENDTRMFLMTRSELKQLSSQLG